MSRSVLFFAGEIPEEIGALTGLYEFSASDNRLTGPLPSALGRLPACRFSTSTTIPLRRDPQGNPSMAAPQRAESRRQRAHGAIRQSSGQLIGESRPLRELPGCARPRREGRRGSTYLKASRWGRKSSRKSWRLTSFHKVTFPEREILDAALDESNLIGAGASGKVYRAVLSDGSTVAVKKLLHAGQSPAQEHRPALVLLYHDDYKLLVYEYLPTGAGDLLHGGKAGRCLDWPARYKIAVDVAEGLSYLHNDCVPPVVHRDVKSTNILLDADFRARIGDFGVAKAVEAAKSMSVIAGSLGYIAPEYAYTLRVSEKSDVYSFGVVLLELVTGRHPLEAGELGEGDLVRWVHRTAEEKGPAAVLDPSLGSEFEEEMFRVTKNQATCWLQPGFEIGEGEVKGAGEEL
ncbi:unnamed protein product [Spirodela intermedia]|uniref:Protein kinase domain-containing protein n=1 Tax=Spirodela intermedia TaxID=51605 RepID=A0A7I8JP37_SPIIN|nr:unnamed protein product [Spirodela intermedia]CAA6671531.1 unnamed protein product [Spirodela intermedia]